MSGRIPPTESENFRKFIEEKVNPVIKKKKICRIMIFGSYKPPEEKKLLKKIRDDLKTDGYNNAWLVEDYPNFKNIGVRNKSLICLEYSHINFFIVTIQGDKGGLTVELEYVIRKASSLSFKTIVFHEIKLENDREIDSLSQLHIEGLYSANIKFISFKKSDYLDLFDLIRAESWRLHYHYTTSEQKY